MLKLIATVIGVCLFTGTIFAEQVDNPAYQNWARFKPGTSVIHSQQTAMGGMNMQMEMTQTLKELTPEKAVVDMTVKNSMMPGGGQTSSVTIPAKVDASQAQAPGKMPEGMKGEAKSLGKETVKVSDKSYECEVTQFTGEGQGMKSEGKSWTSNEVPGSMVKMEMKASGGQGSMDSKMSLKSVVIK